MSTKRLRLDIDTDTDPRALKVLAGALDHAADKADELGDQAKQTAAELAALDAVVKKHRESIRGLGREYAHSGQPEVLKNLREERRLTAELVRIRKELGGGRTGGNERGFFQGLVSKIPAVGGGLATLPTPVLGGLAAGTAVAGGALGSTAILGGVGLAGVAGGAALAAGNPKVRGAYAGLGRTVFAQLREDAEREFVSPLVDSAAEFGAAWEHERPRVQRTLAELGKDVKPLAKGFAGAAEGVLAGFEDAARGARPLMKELGTDLPKIGRGVGGFLSEVSSSGKGAAATFGLLTQAIDGTLLATGGAIVGLSKLAEGVDWLDKHSLGLLEGPLLSAPRLFQGEAEDAGDATDDWSRKLADLARHVGDVSSGLQTLGEVQEKGITAAFDLARATNAWNQGLIELKAATNENGTSLAQNTAEGISNREMLIGQLSTLRDLRTAYMEGGATAAEADARVDALRRQFIKAAIAAGFNKDQVEALTRSLLQLPSYIPVKVKFITEGTIPHPALGQRIGMRSGGVVMAREGLVNLTGQAGVARPGGSPLIGFAEPGNKEAVVSASAPRARSLATLAEAARWHGASVVRDEAVGRLGGAGGGPGRTVTFAGNTDSVFASAFMNLVRSGLISIN